MSHICTSKPCDDTRHKPRTQRGKTCRFAPLCPNLLAGTHYSQGACGACSRHLRRMQQGGFSLEKAERVRQVFLDMRRYQEEAMRNDAAVKARLRKASYNESGARQAMARGRKVIG